MLAYSIPLSHSDEDSQKDVSDDDYDGADRTGGHGYLSGSDLTKFVPHFTQTNRVTPVD